jgi:NitT/TauT family transport system substrate-binding protein
VLDKFSYLTNWRAQAEHGGWYQALAAGIYRKYGIDADIQQGGPQITPSQIMLGGRVDSCMSSAARAISYVAENLPAVCVAALFQKDPQCLMAHPGSGNDSFEAFKGKDILIAAGARVSYWPFLKARFGYTDEQAKPYTFNMAPFLTNKNAIQQCYATSEPYAVEQQGVKPVVLLMADVGFNPYSTPIDTTTRMVAEKPDLVQRFVNATIEGWRDYLIKRENPDMDDGKLAFSIRTMKERGIVTAGDATTLGIGAMTDARWKEIYDQAVAGGQFAAGLDIRKAYTLQFVNKRHGMA